MNEYEISNALQTIWSYIARTNKYIDETAPWSLAKVVEGESQDERESRQEKLKSAMYHLVASLKEISILIHPFLNETSNEILRQLGIDNNVQWDDLKLYKNIKDIHVIEKGEPIFMRLNAEEEIDYIKNLMTK